MEEFDIIVVGAGLTGVNTAYRLQQQMPDHSFAILEARDTIGGTWDFWKYPGARSDSSLPLFGLYWHPWLHESSLGSTEQIRNYIEDAARSQVIDKKIRFRHRVTRTSWSSEEQRWTLDVDVREGSGAEEMVVKKQFKCWFMLACSGYYSYTKALDAKIPGLERFRGRVAHPQWWTDDIEYAGKRVVIIGSGATAVTLLPSISATAAHTTLLQRSPAYVAVVPSYDSFSGFARKWLPFGFVRSFGWWFRMLFENVFVLLCSYFPIVGRTLVMAGARSQLPRGYPVEVHFNPRYNLFDQRLCFCPDGDFFQALHKPNCEMVTDTIETVTESGIQLTSGRLLDADLIITATGLYVELLGGDGPVVDGETVSISDRYVWRSCMTEGVPNSGALMGYFKAVWTPGVDARAQMMIRVMRHMRRIGASSAAPYMDPAERAAARYVAAVDTSATYFQAAVGRLPKTTGAQPWMNAANWFQDMWNVRFGSLSRGMRYTMAERADGKKKTR